MLKSTTDFKPDSERSAAEIRQNIAVEKELIADKVHKLSDRIDETLDWKSQVTKRPILFMGIAAGVGMLLSKALVSKPSPVEQIANAIEKLPLRQNNEQSFIKATLLGLLTKAAVDWVKNKTEISSSRSGRLLS